VNQVGPSGTAHGSSELVKAHTPRRGRPSCRNTLSMPRAQDASSYSYSHGACARVRRGACAMGPWDLGRHVLRRSGSRILLAPPPLAPPSQGTSFSLLPSSLLPPPSSLFLPPFWACGGCVWAIRLAAGIRPGVPARTMKRHERPSPFHPSLHDSAILHLSSRHVQCCDNCIQRYRVRHMYQMYSL
jgi:hypothetical protein